MEVRILTMEEMPQALSIARGVFDYCIRRTIEYPQLAASFENYTRDENIRQLMEQSKLILWGVFVTGRLVAVSGMQREGHITMLYVLPVYQRKGYGRALLCAMRTYAGTNLQLPAVTLNATPAWTGVYFRKNKFAPMDMSQTSRSPFLSMQAKSIRDLSYEKKTIPTGWAVGTAIVGLGICMIVTFGCMFGIFAHMI